MSDPNRRDTLIGGVAALFAGAISDAAQAAGIGQPLPNILWFVSEDNNPYMGAYGDPVAHTPTFDAFAKRSVLYANAFSNAPVCAPSRFGILTGVYPESCAPAHQMTSVAAHWPVALKTYPEYLRDAGYYCTNNFKTDYNCDVDPKRIWDESSRTAHWRNRPEGKPFMSVFNYFTTHESQIFYETPGKVLPADVRVPGYLPDTPAIRKDIASYYNRMEILDSQFASRLKQLDDDGLTDDTIVFYYSDNGGVLPRSKRHAYDEGLRICLMIHVPAKWQHLAPAPAGSIVKTAVSLIDLAPTLLSIIGRPKPSRMPGRALLGPLAAAPERFAFGMRNRMDERYDFCRTVCDGRYRYIRNYTPHLIGAQHNAFEWFAKGYQSWEGEHLANRLDAQRDRFFRAKPYEQFFDLHADRDELHDLIDEASQQSRVAEMRAALNRHMVAINDNGFIPEDSPVEGYYRSQDRTLYPLPELMLLGAAGARRDPVNLPMLRDKLGNGNEVVRYWAATGLLMLGEHAKAALPDLERVMTADPSIHVRIVAAQAAALLGNPEVPVKMLGDIIVMDRYFPVPLQALNALTYIGPAAKLALPQIEKAAGIKNEYIGEAARYLVALLNGTYRPDMQLFDTDMLIGKAQLYVPMPPPTP